MSPDTSCEYKSEDINSNGGYFSRVGRKKYLLAKALSVLSKNNDPVILGTYFSKTFEKYCKLRILFSSTLGISYSRQ